MVQMDTSTLKQKAADIRWYHTINLGGGVVTNGVDNSRFRLERIDFPESLAGRTVLDIGAWDGFFSFEAERRGAARVVASDYYSWRGVGWGTDNGKAGFELARAALGSHVEDIEIDVMELSPEQVGLFDVVLFLGVLYHMRHPLLALERVFSVAGKQLILETHVERLGGSRPVMVFYPGSELNQDPTNWWGPNPAAVEAMLKTVGFRKVVKFLEYPPRERRGLRRQIKGFVPFFHRKDVTRAVFHAWR